MGGLAIIREGSGIRCPACGSTRTGVKDSRPGGDRIRRRRQCDNCGERMTTYEVTDAAFDAALKASNPTLHALPPAVRSTFLRLAKQVADVSGEKKAKMDLGPPMQAGERVATKGEPGTVVRAMFDPGADEWWIAVRLDAKRTVVRRLAEVELMAEAR